MATSMPAASGVTLVDTASLFHAGEAIATEFGGEKRLAPRYDVLRRRLEHFRAEAGWPRAHLNLALAAIDRDNLQQKRFVEALQRAGFAVDDVDFRETFPSQPPSLSRRETDGRPTASFTARIAYIAGLLARQPEASLLLVSHSFELYGPLLDLSHRLKGGCVGVAYFRCLLEYRWQRVEAVQQSAVATDGFRFFDLDAFGEEVFGVNIATKTGSAREVRAGLDRF
jgi:predicted alpha/beta hydrolase